MSASRLATQEEPTQAPISISRQEPLHGITREYPPIIIIGMHRSGTTLLSRLLESLGLFLGKKKDENHEAVLFQRTNEWLLRQVGGAWDNPGPIHYLLENSEMREKTTHYIRRYLLQSPRALSYLGWMNYFHYRQVCALPRPWGWKDPRNTFTLPLWLDIFPTAKIVHLHRAGIDVALSLQRRGRREFQLQRIYRKTRPLHWIRAKRGGFVHSVRCDHLEAGLSLWREYVDAASRHVAIVKNRAFEVSFEALVREPVETLSVLAKFCDLQVEPAVIRRAAAQIDASVLRRRGTDSHPY